ncbi:MAG: DMT family transporter [Erysipelotrichaceae bacterium]|nr:DMT family transporter [Erysipelotrichaceae bacterium]
MNKKKIFGSLILFIGVIIWGVAFVFQSKASEHLGPFYINAIRFLMGGVFLLPFMFISLKKEQKNNVDFNLKKGLVSGLICGIVLFIAANLQQFGIERTSTGKAGFLTAMYIVFVPLILYILYKRKITLMQFFGIILAIIGVGLLSLNNDFKVNIGDVFCLLSAIMFAFQIIFLEKSVLKYNPIFISVVSFFVVSIISFVFAFILEDISFESITNSLGSLIYLGILSTGVGYTFQSLGEKYVSGTPASLIMSLESIIAVIASFIILKERLQDKEILGCIIMFIGVIIVQVFEVKILNKEQ